MLHVLPSIFCEYRGMLDLFIYKENCTVQDSSLCFFTSFLYTTQELACGYENKSKHVVIMSCVQVQLSNNNVGLQNISLS